MGKHPERLGQRPLREGVGRITLVVDREGGFEPRVHQVGVEDRHLLGQHHPLVDDRPAGQRGEVEAGDLLGDGGLLDAPPDDVKLALERLMVERPLAADEDLLDLGTRGVGLLAQHRDVDGDVAPAVDRMASAQDLGLDDGPAALLGGEVGARQEDLAYGDEAGHVGLVPRPPHLVVEEGHGDLDVDAGAVAGLAVGVDGAPVPDGAQRLDALLDDAPRRLPVNGHHQPDAAGRMLVILAVERVLGHPSALLGLGAHPGGSGGFVEMGHDASPSTNGLAAS